MQAFMGEIKNNRAHELDKLSEGKPFNSFSRKRKIFNLIDLRLIS